MIDTCLNVNKGFSFEVWLVAELDEDAKDVKGDGEREQEAGDAGDAGDAGLVGLSHIALS